MSYRFIFCKSDSHRIVPAVLIDNRANIPEIKNKVGSVIKTFTDAQAAMVGDTEMFYKIETENGNLAGYFTLMYVRAGEVSRLQFELRAAYQQFSAEISGLVSTFIQTSGWQADWL